MPDKKQTETGNWKDRLDSPEQLTAESTIDKNAAWERLSVRLHKKQPSLTRYWIAAAILILIAISWLLIERKDDSIVKTGIHPYHDSAIANSMLPDPVTKKRAIAILPVSPQVTRVKKHKRVHKDSSSFLIDSAQAIEKTATPAMVAPLSETAGITTVVSKKKLRVVHINELETMPAPQSQPAFAAMAEKMNSWFKFKNSSSPNSSTVGRQENISIKIPLTN